MCIVHKKKEYQLKHNVFNEYKTIIIYLTQQQNEIENLMKNIIQQIHTIHGFILQDGKKMYNLNKN